MVEMFFCATNGETIPIEALLFLGGFVALFALFAVAWVRKRARRFEDERDDEQVPPSPRAKRPRPTPPPEPDGVPARDPVAEEVEEPERARFELGEPRSIREGLERTQRDGFVSRLGKIFKGKQLDEDLLEEVEEVLFTSDIGVKTSQRLLEDMRQELQRKELSDPKVVWNFLRTDSQRTLEAAAEKHPIREHESGSPRVIMVIGVNGTGKTTSIGKLAARYTAQGQRVLLAAGDTFRAAAVEQLEVWGRRVRADVHRGASEADPASVVFDAVTRAKKDKYDLVLVDTAGRLHTSVNLMAELEKIHRVIGKALPGAPHEVLLVLDATMGQNAIQQAQMFRDSVAVTGIVLAKLDGTAKGGVVIGISDQLQIPIRWVGVGERIQDTRPFVPRDFVDALFG